MSAKVSTGSPQLGFVSRIPRWKRQRDMHRTTCYSMTAAIVILLGLTLSACGHVPSGFGAAPMETGPDVETGTTALLNPALRARLKIGETTQRQIYQWFGPPAMTSRGGIAEVWSYSLSRGWTAPPRYENHALGLAFSKDGILRNIVETNTPPRR
jgi:outer membrane protein assembly factor BamE (lipoprotein component of BamABCDE complex)